MSYEAQIAGVGDAAARPRRCAARAIRGDAAAASARSCAGAGRRGRGRPGDAALEFVNGGGTGSVGATAADAAVTEVTAGSGLYGPTLFDAYRASRPGPAALLRAAGGAAPRARAWPPCSAAAGSRPARPASDRLPTPGLPAGLRLTPTRAPARCRRRCAAPGGRAARRRPGVVPSRQGRRAVRARRTTCTWSTATGRRHRAHLPRRGPRVPVSVRFVADGSASDRTDHRAPTVPPRLAHRLAHRLADRHARRPARIAL